MNTISRQAMLAVLTSVSTVLAQTPPPQSRVRSVPSAQQTPVPPPLTNEKAFYYFIAIYGYPANAIERFGRYFDAGNYSRAMADEFERGRYAERIRTQIADGVRKINFSDKFTVVGSNTFEGQTMIGEYSFQSHSFPIAHLPYDSFCIDINRSSTGVCSGSFLSIGRNARVEDAVNEKEFSWSLPMSEADASAFVKSRSTAGGVDRRVAARITYSVMNKQRKLKDGRDGFTPYVYSVEIFGDMSLTKRLAIITPQPGTPVSAFMADAAQTAQTAAGVIGTYQYIASYIDTQPGRAIGANMGAPKPILGTLTLSDVGVSLSGEQPNGGAIARRFSFFDRLYLRAEDVIVLRENESYGCGFHVKGFMPTVAFSSLQERDRFFVALASTMREWAAKYPQFASAKVEFDQRCLVNTRLYTCSESTPFHGNGRCGETEQGRGTEGLETKTAQSPTDSTISRPTPTSNTPAQGLSSQPNNSATVILAEFEVGKEVSVPVKYNSAVPGYTYMADGLVTLSKTLFKFRPTYGSEPFAVSPEKILELVIEPQQASRLLVKVAVLNKKGNKEEKRNYYFYPAGAVGVGGGPGGQGASISCSSCNDSMTVLHALLLKFRGTGSL